MPKRENVIGAWSTAGHTSERPLRSFSTCSILALPGADGVVCAVCDWSTSSGTSSSSATPCATLNSPGPHHLAVQGTCLCFSSKTNGCPGQLRSGDRGDDNLPAEKLDASASNGSATIRTELYRGASTAEGCPGPDNLMRADWVYAAHTREVENKRLRRHTWSACSSTVIHQTGRSGLLKFSEHPSAQ
jgi:hypothetical protein